MIRDDKVSKIVVTVSSGKSFDGDEMSQTRMSRAITVMNNDPTITYINWKLHNNAIAEVTKEEFIEAVKLAGQQQTNYWMM